MAKYKFIAESDIELIFGEGTNKGHAFFNKGQYVPFYLDNMNVVVEVNLGKDKTAGLEIQDKEMATEFINSVICSELELSESENNDVSIGALILEGYTPTEIVNYMVAKDKKISGTTLKAVEGRSRKQTLSFKKKVELANSNVPTMESKQRLVVHSMRTYKHENKSFNTGSLFIENIKDVDRKSKAGMSKDDEEELKSLEGKIMKNGKKMLTASEVDKMDTLMKKKKDNGLSNREEGELSRIAKKAEKMGVNTLGEGEAKRLKILRKKSNKESSRIKDNILKEGGMTISSEAEFKQAAANKGLIVSEEPDGKLIAKKGDKVFGEFMDGEGFIMDDGEETMESLKKKIGIAISEEESLDMITADPTLGAALDGETQLKPLAGGKFVPSEESFRQLASGQNNTITQEDDFLISTSPLGEMTGWFWIGGSEDENFGMFGVTPEDVEAVVNSGTAPSMIDFGNIAGGVKRGPEAASLGEQDEGDDMEDDSEDDEDMEDDSEDDEDTKSKEDTSEKEIEDPDRATTGNRDLPKDSEAEFRQEAGNLGLSVVEKDGLVWAVSDEGEFFGVFRDGQSFFSAQGMDTPEALLSASGISV